MAKPTEEQVRDIFAMTQEIYGDVSNALLSSSKKFEGQNEVYVQSALMSSLTRLLLHTGLATGLEYDAIRDGFVTCIDLYKAEQETEEPKPKYMN